MFEAAEADLAAVKKVLEDTHLQGCVVRLRGLPYTATAADVAAFFEVIVLKMHLFHMAAKHKDKQQRTQTKSSSSKSVTSSSAFLETSAYLQPGTPVVSHKCQYWFDKGP
jgi:hypothetical protein